MSNSPLSLYELNSLVRGLISEGLSDMYWIRAEMSDVRVNQNGHCYLEFIEKDKSNRTVVAKARAMIWSNTFYLLRAYFENTTKQPFASGIKVLVKVSVEFHELYGFSLVVHDIDPSYTLGDQALNRAAIIRQLEEEGVLSLNKELDFPVLANRIAIISSPTAAGYEDFMNQIDHNAYGFVFYTKLFPAVMQGDRAEVSIIDALEQIYNHQDCFDLVVIIRGGGATSELSCFDSYLLAASCAQFPLPVVTGIGHERDETVLDIVAHTRAKTPTAVAEFLIGRILDTAMELEGYSQALVKDVRQSVVDELSRLAIFQERISMLLRGWNKTQHNMLDNIYSNLQKTTKMLIKEQEAKLAIFDKSLVLVSPETILKKGYSLTLKDGKPVKSVHDILPDDRITSMFSDGSVESIVVDKK